MGFDSAAAVICSLEFLPNPVDVAIIVLNIAPDHSHLAFQLLVSSLQHIGFQADGFQVSILFPQSLTQLLRLCVQLFQFFMSLLQDKRRRSIVLLCLLGSGRQFLQGVQPNGYFHAPKLVLHFQILSGFFGLHPQRLQLQLQFRGNVTDSHEVILCAGELSLRFFLAVAVFGNTGGFFKDLPAVCALQGQNLVNTTLANVGITFLAQAGIHKQLVNIPQSGGLAVDIVFAVTAAVIPAGDHDLICVIAQGPVRIIQGQSCFRKANGRTLLRAIKDHVLHFCATEGLCALLTHNPEDGIGNIRFAGTVGTDDGGDIVTEPDQSLIREGLKALHFQTFQIHSKTSCKYVKIINLLYPTKVQNASYSFAFSVIFPVIRIGLQFPGSLL